MSHGLRRMRILADIHERASGVPRLLEERGIAVEIESLSIGDYEVGDRAIVERKTVRGLHAGISDGTCCLSSVDFAMRRVSDTSLLKGPISMTAHSRLLRSAGYVSRSWTSTWEFSDRRVQLTLLSGCIASPSDGPNCSPVTGLLTPNAQSGRPAFRPPKPRSRVCRESRMSMPRNSFRDSGTWA